MNPPDDIREALREAGLLETAHRVAREHRVDLTRVLSGDRHKAPAAARQHLWALIRNTLGWSFPEVARLFGVDHTSVMYGVKKCEAQLEDEYRRTA